MKVAGNGVTFNKGVTIHDAEVTLDNVVLVASAETASKTAAALSVDGTKPFTLKNSTVNGVSRTAVSLKTSGKITIMDNTFDGGDKSIYNMIEFSISNAADITNAEILNNEFVGDLKNNCISLYNVADNAVIDIDNNSFKNISVDNNVVRLSNPKNNATTFNIENNVYTFSGRTPNAQGFTAFLLLEDYTAAGKGKQDFSKFTINFKNLKRGSKKLTFNGEGLDKVFYVYDDQDGILAAGVNDPIVNFA